MTDKKRLQDAFSSLEVSLDCIQEVLNMKSIQEVMTMTGLTETQMRVYIDENLIHPKAEASKHLKAGALIGSEVEQLQAIQSLRIHEFGLEEIKVLKICGSHSSELLQEKTEEKRKPYETMPDVLSAIEVLQRLAPEGKEREKLCKTLPGRLRVFAKTPADQQIKRNPFLEKYMPKLILLAILSLLLALFLINLESLPGRVMGVFVLICAASVISIGSGIWYLLRRKAPRQYSREGYGTIIKVTQDTRFDASFAMGHSVVPGSGFSEQGRGGLWQFVFMFWNEIRPDNWYPLIRYQDGDTERIGSVRFGGFKYTWKEGDTIAIRWTERDDGTVYPADGSFFIRKGAIALVLGILLMTLFVRFIGPVFQTANSPMAPYVTTVGELLHGVPDEFTGNETISDREIQLDYTCFTGVREYTIHAGKGDVLYVETLDDPYDFAAAKDRIQLSISRNHTGSVYPDSFNEKTEAGTYLSVYRLGQDADYILTLQNYKGNGSIHIWVETEP